MARRTPKELRLGFERELLRHQERESRRVRPQVACARCGRDVDRRTAVVSRWTGNTYCGAADLEECARVANELPREGQLSLAMLSSTI
jgi:endogenous inhibitor of DNA gyrase (YacG/DUF329 family)